MLLRTTFLLISFMTFFSSETFSASRADVVPVDWSKFSRQAPGDSLALNIKVSLLKASKYFLDHYVDSLKEYPSGLFALDSYPDLGHEGIREPSAGAAFVSMAIATGAFDSTIVGRSKQEVLFLIAKLVKSIAAMHTSNGGTYWGGCWQCAPWASDAGFATWLIWDNIDTTTQTMVARMVEGEANRFNKNPPYCNDCTNDTKAEENAWNARVMTLATAMMPNHANVSWWKFRASQWMLSSYAREVDLESEVLVDGQPPSDWISGWNAREPGYVYNHSILHPDYMTSVNCNLYSILFQSLARQPVSEAAVFSYGTIYSCFVDYAFGVPPFRSPGGTMYLPGKAKIYYPMGTDWSIHTVDRFMEMDIFASILPEVANKVSIHPLEWARIRSDTLTWMQSRFTTGQHYAPREWDGGGQQPWMLAEIIGGFWMGASYFALWLQEQDGLMPIRNWHLPDADSVAPHAPEILAAEALDPSTVELSWSKPFDSGSGAAYYYVYRNNVKRAFIKDTFWIDYSCIGNTEYRYKIVAIDRANNKSPESNEAVVTTPPDTAAFFITKINAVNDSHIVVGFSRIVDSVSAGNSTNYLIDGATINRLQMAPSGNMVTLVVSGMQANGNYQLIVSNISDVAVPVPHTLDTALQFAYQATGRKLALYWPLDEKRGNALEDFSGNGLNGILTEGYSRIEGVVNSGLYLASRSYGNAGSVMRTLHFPLTLSLWIKFEGDSARALVSTEDVAGRYYGAWMGINGNGQININIGNGGSAGASSRKTRLSASTVTKNSWSHVCAVVRSVTDMSIYINGVDAGGVYSGSATAMNHSSGGTFQIGYQTSASNPILYYKGGMDEVRVYSDSLSADVIGMLASALPTKNETSTQQIGSPVTLMATPNPFNPAINIRYLLQVAGRAIIEVYDINGNKVCVLTDEHKKKGLHSITWNAASYGSGLYLLSVSAGNTKVNRKIILMK